MTYALLRPLLLLLLSALLRHYFPHLLLPLLPQPHPLALLGLKMVMPMT